MRPTFSFPWDVIPADGRFTATISGKDNPELVFNAQNGVRVYYQEGQITGNVLRFMAALLMHYGIIIAVGLAIGVAFTISVASFVSAVAYFLAISTSFFQGFLKDLVQDESGALIYRFGQFMVRLGLFLTTGLEQPGIVRSLARNQYVGLETLGLNMTQWFGNILLWPVRVTSAELARSLSDLGIATLLGWLAYFAFCVMAGMLLLRRKELDRVH